MDICADILKLQELMIKHGLVIRAIPHEYSATYEARHKDKHPHGIEYFDKKVGRNMLRVTHKNSKGGKFIIVKQGWQGDMVRFGSNIVFYDSIEQAVNSVVNT